MMVNNSIDVNFYCYKCISQGKFYWLQLILNNLKVDFLQYNENQRI